MIFNCGVRENSWESLGLQADSTSASYRKSVLIMHWKEWCLSWISNTLATWCKEPILCKRPGCWERLKAEEGDDRGWDDWMASLTEWTWIWVGSRSWWWTGKPYMLQSMGVAKSWTQLSNWNALNELNGLVVFPTFFNLSLNLAISSSWSVPQSAPSLGFANCVESLHLWLQTI